MKHVFEINFYNSTISADAPGRDLVLDASPTAAGFGIVLRGLGNTGGAYVNDLTLDYGERGRRSIQRFLDEGTAAGIVPPVGPVTFVS